MSIVIKERERERDRDWDRESYRGDDRPRNVTIRRYKVPDRNEEDRFETTSRYSRRDDGPRHDHRDDVREFRFERETSNRRPDYDLDEYRSERARSPPREVEVRDIQISRDISREPPRRERDPYELDHYTKTTDYYAREPDPRPIVIRQNAPQPIIIREEAPQPIVIRERERERERERSERPSSPRSAFLERQREEERQERQSHYSRHTEVDKRSEARRTEHDRQTEIDRRTEVNEDRTVAVREEPQVPVRQEPEDEYYFQRKTRQIARDDYDDYRRQRKERRPRRRDDEFSDEEYYYRREERNYDGEGSRARSKSRRRLDVAEGAVAGLGAAALLNRRNQNREDGKSGGIKNLAGGAVLGAVGGEVVNRARSRFRGGSESRSRSRSYDRHDRSRRRRRHDSRSRSRSESKSRGRIGDLGKLAGVAAIGALAGYAASRKRGNKGEEDDRRSRSRVRRASLERSRSRSHDSFASRSSSRSHDQRDQPNEALSSKKRNATMAKAGVASAAIAGIADRVRSKSRGGRSQSRARQSLPIAAAGLGGAALAGLYENQKAKKEKQNIARDEDKDKVGRKSRSRSRPRAASRGADSYDNEHGGLPAIEYGGAPIPPADAYGRPRSRADSYYSENGIPQGRRSLSSDSSSPRRHRRSSRNHDRAADAGAGAGVAGMAAHDASKRRERKRAERERRRQEEAAQETPPAVPPGPDYGFGPYSQEPQQPLPPPQPEYPEHYFPQAGANAYPSPNAYPPSNAYSPVPNFVGQQQPQAQHPYGAPNGYQQPGMPPHDPYGYPGGTPQPGPYPGNHVSSAPRDFELGREDVNHGSDSHAAHDMDPRERRKSVQFNLNPNVQAQSTSPDVSPRSQPDSDRSPFDGPGDPHGPEGSDDTVRHHPKQHSSNSGRQRQEQGGSEPSQQSSSSRRHGNPQDNQHDSTDTEDLPPRFDSNGRRIGEEMREGLTYHVGHAIDNVENLLSRARPGSGSGSGSGHGHGGRRR